MTKAKTSKTSKTTTEKTPEAIELEAAKSELMEMHAANDTANELLNDTRVVLQNSLTSAADLRQQITNLKIERTSLFQALWDCQKEKKVLLDRCGAPITELEKGANA